MMTRTLKNPKTALGVCQLLLRSLLKGHEHGEEVVLTAEGDGADAKYFNTPTTALYLDRSSPRYIGGIPEMLNARLFKYWNDLPEALRTGKPQNETKHGGDAFDYSAADFEKWCREVGFNRFEVIHLAGPSSAAIAYK